jgi:hypothetical protein
MCICIPISKGNTQPPSGRWRRLVAKPRLLFALGALVVALFAQVLQPTVWPNLLAVLLVAGLTTTGWQAATPLPLSPIRTGFSFWSMLLGSLLALSTGGWLLPGLLLYLGGGWLVVSEWRRQRFWQSHWHPG